MILLSFNVNSINAYLKKELLSQWINLSPDLIGIEELKMSETEHKDFPLKLDSYTPYWTVSKVKKGYSGTAVLTKKEPISVHYGLLDSKYDDEGRATTLEFDNFYFVTLYVPNSGEELKRLNYRMTFESDLREYLKSLMSKKSVIVTGDLKETPTGAISKPKPIIICGDFNVAYESKDLANPSSNHHNAGFTDEERANFKALLDLGFIDTYRYLHPDKIEYSWWSYRFKARERNAGWRLDYFLVSQDIIGKVKESKILTDVYGSDHCPVLLEIDI